MNDELKTKEYLKSLESITLADSSRLRMREELRSFAQFHTAAEVPSPVKSSFSWLLLKPVQAAFAFVLVLGVGTAVYLSEDGTYDTPSVATIDSPLSESESATSSSHEETQTKEESTKLAVAPAQMSNPPTTPTESAPQENFMQSAANQESADMASDEMVMTTMLSQGEMNIDNYRADIVIREKTYRTLISTYEKEISSETATELIDKLNRVATLLKNAEGKDDEEVRPLLDTAMIVTGEIEATLSLLGEVTIENGVITDITFIQ